jgi:serine/threonine protein kinase
MPLVASYKQLVLAFGEVWRAEWSALQGQVAVKILKAAMAEMDGNTRAEFEREAEFLQVRTKH